MRSTENWIWLPEKSYPDSATTYFSPLAKTTAGNYTVARFTKEYSFDRPVSRVDIRVSGDTAYRLFVSDVRAADGPASAGGDFLNNDRPRPSFYADNVSVEAADVGDGSFASGCVRFTAEVRMQPCRMCEYSRGHGGFMLTAHVLFEDGTETLVNTDGTWQSERLDGYLADGRYESAGKSAAVPAEVVRNVWFAEDAPIPVMAHEKLIPTDIAVPSGKKLTVDLPLSAIVAGHLAVKAHAIDGTLNVTAYFYETPDDEGGVTETYCFRGDDAYEGFSLISIGGVRLKCENTGKSDASLSVGVLTSYYPINIVGGVTTDDEALNEVTRVAANTLKYCRQTLHLDSPRHCEPLACTGDYYIESLMTAALYGDMRLAAFDVRRTAELLCHNDGRMFHTTYSLIFVLMLYDVYLYTGDRQLLTDCADALTKLLDRFETYLGGNGLIETPPDYMFIDWLVPDGISTHHPPKALGQTCLCMFYYGALTAAAKIYAAIGKTAMAEKRKCAAKNLRTAITELLYDKDRKLFFEGLNTPTPESLLGEFMPQNVEKRYFRRHANILAAYFGILPKKDCKALVTRVFEDDSLGEVQPYFMHFYLEAVRRCKLCESYTMPLLSMWKEPVSACKSGLPEGFYKPEPTYRFDHSHAWGGTPAYALPMALTGLEILEPGCRVIALDPKLLGSLNYANINFPTPFGMINVTLEKDSPGSVRISVPAGIRVEGSL